MLEVGYSLFSTTLSICIEELNRTAEYFAVYLIHGRDFNSVPLKCELKLYRFAYCLRSECVQ
jgi:hypothetical protein